ncbi:MAG: ribonuclease E/G, partial [Burkholderiales bacterium]|nr:ribonuclease E/G [Burkholderiales bacterium]
LQILRIIQEETLKDNTAAVHVQVPVEVTSFLLNEKRTEITKIELKQRCTVLLVPNKHLETPNYKLERLRHDDPRLENLQASYTMIEEPDDEVAISRREKAKAKQEPVIKGLLPDEPAPIAPAKPEPVVAAPAAPAVAPATPSWAAAPPPAASGGFFGWLKKLLGGGGETAAATVQPAPAMAAPTGAATPAADKQREGRDGGRRGGRNERGGRGGRDGRSADNREGRGEGRGEGQGRNRRDGRPPRANAGDTSTAETGVEAPRRTPRHEREARPVAEAVAPAALAELDNTAPLAEGAEGERDEQRRRRRRRGGRGRDEGRTDSATPDSTTSDSTGTDLQADAGDTLPAAETPAPGEEGGENRRRGRGRDRQRREPREQQDDSAVASAQVSNEVAAPIEATPSVDAASDEVPTPAAPHRSMLDAIAPPQIEPKPAEPVAAEPMRVAVEPFVLPITDLQQIAETSGLQWVHSDSAKVRAAQDAIAATPPPAHVPRERKPVPVMDAGPLVLVETRKDLSAMKLPFENPAP